VTRSADITPVVRLSASAEQQLYERSGASRWGLSPETFATKLRTCVAKRFQGQTAPPERDADAAARSLHVEDLALACACALGSEPAWEHFIRELRPALYAAARQIAPAAPQELADSLYAELFGLEVRDGRRRSLLDYYHGRARLATWLRTVLAQRHVDALRSSSRTISLDADERPLEPVDPAPAADPERARYVEHAQRALDAALRSLVPRDRLRLRLYHGEGVKLAQIGRVLGEHEATVSRKLDRTRQEIRRYVERALQDDHGLTPAAVAECLVYAAGAPELEISRALAADDG
jgi:RNA polymerase sigma-70 factor, ECF subfamily